MASKKSMVSEFEIDTYKQLKAKSAVGDGLDIHHIIQWKVAEQLCLGYKHANGICIAIKSASHDKIPTMKEAEIKEKYTNKTGRQVLAAEILRNKEAGVIPNIYLREAIRQHKAMYPTVFEKYGDSTSACVSAEPIFEAYERLLIQEDQKLLEDRFSNNSDQYLKNGNRLNSLPTKVRDLITTGQVSSSCGDNGSDAKNIVGTYTVHEAYEPALGCALKLNVHIAYVRTDRKERVVGNTKVITLTHIYEIKYGWY